MEYRANRVLNAVQQWLDMEKENRPFFSDRQWVSAEKLQYYDRILKTFGRTTNMAERITLNEVRKDVLAMEATLYPYWTPVKMGLRVARFLNSLRSDRSWEKDTERLKQYLLPELPAAGFSGAARKVEHQLDQGYRTFQVREHAYLNDNRMVHLTFCYEPGVKGVTTLSTVQVVMPAVKSQEKEVHFSYKPAEAGLLNIHQLRNLAGGRIVAAEVQQDPYLQSPTTYIELLNGELRISGARAIVGEEQLRGLPFREVRQQEEMRAVLSKLKMGDQVEVTHAYTQERYFLQLSRSTHTVEISNDRGGKVPLQTISESAMPAKMKQEQAQAKPLQKQHPVIGRDRSRGQSDGQVTL